MGAFQPSRSEVAWYSDLQLTCQDTKHLPTTVMQFGLAGDNISLSDHTIQNSIFTDKTTHVTCVSVCISQWMLLAVAQ